MFEHALVAVDLAPSGDLLVGCAPELGALGIRRLTLLHVAPVDYPMAGAVAHLDKYREALEALADDLRNQGFEVTADVRPGNPPREILRAAREAGADLILIGSRSRSRLRKAFVGSVTLKVLEESHLPVLFLRIEPDGDDPEASLAAFCCPMDGPVLLASDTSPASERAASVARALAREGEGRPLTVLHAGEGEPAEAIVAAASKDDAPLLVMGSRGKGLIRRMALGSVSRDVIGRIRSPVLLVPEASE